jgi:acetoin utilization deacetylase AcuC-like enzyme
VVLVVNQTYEDEGHEESGHPERPERVIATRAGITDLHLGSDLIVAASRVATRDELARVHDGHYLEELAAFCYEGGGDLDQDTYATLDSWQIAKEAAGGGLAVIEELQRRGDGVGFVVTRPPGHHALRDQAMGFCLLNNIAVAAATLRGQGERVVIVDWDVHHGNGTQQIFWDDAEVLYISSHQWPLFPGSGAASEVGGPHAIDRTVNIPLPPGATGDVLRQAFDDIAAPVIDSFGPTWVLVSAGFDAHRADPMADLQFSSSDFAALTRSVADLVPQSGRLAMFLEGGYDLDALRSSVHATISSALGDAALTEQLSHGGPGRGNITRIQRDRSTAIESLRSRQDEKNTE